MSIKSEFNELGDTAVLEYFQQFASIFKFISVAPLKQMTHEAAGDLLACKPAVSQGLATAR